MKFKQSIKRMNLVEAGSRMNHLVEAGSRMNLVEAGSRMNLVEAGSIKRLHLVPRGPCFRDEGSAFLQGGR